MIFYSLSQVLTNLGEKKKFQEGDVFAFVVRGKIFRFKWRGDESDYKYTLYNYTCCSNREVNYEFIQEFFGGSTNTMEGVVRGLMSRSYYSSSVFSSFPLQDSIKIIVKLFEIYEGIRSSSYSESLDEPMRELSSKFYGEGITVPESKVKVFGDGTVCLKSDVGCILNTTNEVPLFSVEWFFIQNDKILYLNTKPRTTICRYSRSNSDRILIDSITEDSGIILVRDYAYDKKYFLSGIGGFCPILNQYYIGSRELVSDGQLKQYHSDQQNVIVRAKGGKMFFGIELERSEIVDLDYDKAAEDGWRCERDGSVAAEYISPVLSLDNIEESIDWIKDTSQGILDAAINSNCGGHIHVSVAGVESGSLYRKFAVFMPLLWAIYPARASNGYSARPNGQDAYLGCESVSRRDLVHKPHIGTVEFRIFPGCKGEKMLRFRLRLLKLIVSKALEFPDDVTFKDALDFLLSSEEIFDMLSYVYNSADKMKGISKRISDCYRSVEELSTDMDIQATLLLSVKEFVASKKLDIETGGEIVDSI